MQSTWRALGIVGLVLVALIIGVGFIVQGDGPNPITDAAAWVKWAREDPITALVMIVGAVMAGLAAAQLFGPKPMSKDDNQAALDKLRDEIIAEIRGAHGGAPADAASESAVVEAAREIVETGGPAERAAAELIAEGRFDEGYARLRQDALADDLKAADKWRRLGALAYPVDVTVALDAYGRAAERDPTDVWTHIFLSRLYRASGNLPAARASADTALAAATDPRDKGCALNDFGDIARAEGDLTAARTAYQAGLEIRRDLSNRDPKNTEWLRDLSVSQNKLGDIAVAEGDLPAARTAYQAGLEIARDLSNRDPKNTQWLRDLSISHDKLGDIAVAEGDLTAARTAYQADLEIARDLSNRDPKNTQWLRDLSVSQNNLGDIAVAEGDLPAARTAYQAGLEIARDLSNRDPKNTEWLRDLAIFHAKLAQTAEAEGDLTGARAGFLEAERRFRDILAISPTHAETRRMAELAAADEARLIG